MSKHTQNSTHLWECGGIHIICEIPENFSELAFSFYPELYKQLAAYTKKQDIDHMCVHNTLAEKENTMHYGQWPLVGQIIDVYHCKMFYSFLKLNRLDEEKV